ncbi:MAG: hypothetical protein SH819_03410 [Cytophagales bacterium]|nr:hypothetical protein [Cytophagales bacterium]
MNQIILLLDVVLLAGAAIAIYRKEDPAQRRLYWPALGVKIAAGAALGVLFLYYYELGDTISYWQDGRKIASLMTDDPRGAIAFFWDESTNPDFAGTLSLQTARSLFFVKIAGAVALLTGGNYWMMSAFLSFVSFLASWYLFRQISNLFPQRRIEAALAFLFFPSVVFWSSGLIKESLGLASLFVLAGICISVTQSRRVSFSGWLLALISVWVGWNLKYYWIGVFIPVAATTLLMYRWKRLPWPALVRYEMVVWILVFLSLLLIATGVHPNFYPSRFLDVIYQNNLEFMALSDPQGVIHYHDLRPTVASMLLNAPVAFVSGLFRPFIWESANLLSVVAALENLAVLAMVIFALPSLLTLHRSTHRLLVVAMIVYIVLLTTFLALSTPNFGTLSRYKVGLSPFLLFLCLSGNRLVHWVFPGNR